MDCVGLGLGLACLGLATGGDLSGGTSHQEVVTVTVCAPLVLWTKEEQQAAAVELRKLPAKHPLRVMNQRYVKQRDLVRTCK